MEDWNANIREEGGGSTLEKCADVIGRELNVGQASPRALGDETASWTKTMATGSLDRSLDFAPRFGDFLGFLFSNLLSRSGSRPLRVFTG